MKIYSIVFGLLVLGLLFSAEFEDIYIRRVESQDGDQTILVTNCDQGGKEPTWVTVKVWTPNPFGESTHALFYYKNATTGGWTQIYDCTVLQYGKECIVFLPLYLGGMGDKTESLEVIRATMERGSTSYEADMEISFTHARTEKERIVDNKTAAYSTLLAEAGTHSFCNSDRSLCCKLQTDYSSVTGLENRSKALQKECQVDAARILIENAINTLRAINGNASACSAALAEVASAEQTATQRGCNSGSVRTQIDGLKAEIRNGNYALSLAALNSAMSSQCLGGASVEEVEPGDVDTGTGAGGTDTGGTGTGSTDTGSSGSSKPMCPGMFILFLLPFALMVYRWDF